MCFCSMVKGRVLKKGLFFFFLWGFVTLNSFAEQSVLPMYTPPVKAPEIVWEDAYGNKKSLKDYAGKVVFLNFWATWCGPCTLEMPAFNFLQNRYGLGGLNVIALNVGNESPEKIFTFFQEKKLDALDIHIDKTLSLTKIFGANMLPSTYVINRKGEVVAGKVGVASWMSADMMAFVEQLLKEKDPYETPFYSPKSVHDISDDMRY